MSDHRESGKLQKPSPGLLNMLTKIYAKVESLQDFVKRIATRNRVDTNSCGPEFCNFLNRSLVAYPTMDHFNRLVELARTDANRNPSLHGTETCTYHETLLKAIKKAYDSEHKYSDPNIIVKYCHTWYIDIFSKLQAGMIIQSELQEYFKSIHVKQLYTILSAKCFIYLLTECAMFEYLSSSSCVQRSGVPASAIMPQVKNTLSFECTNHHKHCFLIQKTLCKKNIPKNKPINQDQSFMAKKQGITSCRSAAMPECALNFNTALREATTARCFTAKPKQDCSFAETTVPSKKIKIMAETKEMPKANTLKIPENVVPTCSLMEKGTDEVREDSSQNASKCNQHSTTRSENLDTFEPSSVFSDNNSNCDIFWTSDAESEDSDQTSAGLCIPNGKMIAEATTSEIPVIASWETEASAKDVEMDDIFADTDDSSSLLQSRQAVDQTNKDTVIAPSLKVSIPQENKLKNCHENLNDPSGQVRTTDSRKESITMLPFTKPNSSVQCKPHKPTRRGKRSRKTTKLCLAPGKPTVMISRSFVFYSKQLEERLPDSCMLTTTPGNEGGAMRLCETIFSTKTNCCPLDEKQKHELMPILVNMIKQFHGWAYTKTLQCCCPVNNSTLNKMDMQGFIAQHCSYEMVSKFIRSSLEAILPSKLLGSARNFEILVQKLDDLVSCSKTDILWLHHFTSGLKIKEIPWLWDSMYPCRYQLCQLVLWLIQELVLQLIKGFFYVTEGSSSKHQLFYYRKCIWKKLHNLGVNEFLKSGKFQEVKGEEKEALKNRATGYFFHSVRFIPKSSTLRPIIASKSQSTLAFNGLRAIFASKKFQAIQSCMSAKDLLPVLKSLSKCSQQTFYFVKVDIRDCFTNMNHEKLLSVYKDILKAMDVTAFDVFKVSHIRHENGHLRARYLWLSIPSGTCQKEILNTFTSKLGIVTILGQVGALSTSAILKFLRQYIEKNMVQIGQRIFKMISGIRQGGALSSGLCNMYLDSLTKKHLADFGDQPDEHLFRVVDDFLYITPHVKKARRFLQVMSAGFPDFTCNINPAKVSINFEYENIPPLAEDEPIKYFGLLIDQKTLEVGVDYSCYCKHPLRFTMTLNQKRPGMKAREKLLSFAMRSTPSIILDMQLNSRHTVIKNLYERFLFMSLQLHSILMNQPEKQRFSNNMFILHLVLDVGETMVQKIQLLKQQGSIEFNLNQYQVIFICCKAFLYMFKKQGRAYEEVAEMLRQVMAINYEKHIPKKQRSTFHGILNGLQNDWVDKINV